jgi:hypothetical protein
MNIRNNPNWSIRHESRLQTLLANEGLLTELRETSPDQVETWNPIDLLDSKRSAEQVMESLMSIEPSERALITANAMFETH